MSTCEMCGREASLVKAKIEGTELELCPNCAKFGEVIARPAPIYTKNIPHSRPVQRPRRKEVLQIVVDDYADRIRTARNKLGLTQEEFSKRLNERASIMQKMEAGQFKPSIDTARKLEKLLKVRLVEQYDEKGDMPVASGHQSKSEGFTMGDFIKDKRKK